MGNVCSPSVSCDASISRCLDCSVRKAAYTCHLQENLDALWAELQLLIQARNDVKIKVILAEQQQMRRLEQVQGWLLRVQDVETEVTELRQQGDLEVDKLCLGGLCSKNCKSIYKLGEKVFRKLSEVRSLRIQGGFKEVAQPAPEKSVDERPLPPTVFGLRSTFDSVWRCLMEEQTGIVGLYGIGGVGKTALLTQINNKFLDMPNHFDFVIWVVVSKNLQIEKIQESIAKKIGLFNESWDRKIHQEKASEIFKIMSNKKFVLFLDDLWEPVELIQLGLPVPSRVSASTKVVFTTRELDVCGQMEAHKKFKVECLKDEDAWKLFEEKVGKDILASHLDIPKLAKTVAKECGGLPLSLITVGRAMASKKTLREWEHAIEVLKSSASKFSGMVNKVFARIKLSYDSLPSDASRFCLLYCSLYPEDDRISIEDLIDCWICEELLDEYDGIRARQEGYSIIRSLVDGCLLEEFGDNFVKMHDVIRDMALWIASASNNEKERFLVLAGAGLSRAPSIGMWKEVTRMSLMRNNIKDVVESPTSPPLRTLFLSYNSLNGGIASDFFRSNAFPCLRVLKLSNTSLPDDSLLGISVLVSLKYLDLSNSRVKSLPLELKHLINLKCLNLEWMTNLSRIPPQLISNLKKLRSLRMYGSGLDVSQEEDSILYGNCIALVEELVGLEHLNVLTLTLHSFEALEKLLSSPVLLQHKTTRVSSLFLNACHHSRSLSVSSLARLNHLQKLRFWHSDLEEIHLGQPKGIRGIRGFHSLREVVIRDCKMKQVTWLILAPHLKSLEIRNCKDLEDVISASKLGEAAATEAEEIENLVPFARLEYLTLDGLSKLKSIHSTRALSFPILKVITVKRCPELKRLPLDCNIAGMERKFLIKGSQAWWNRLQWDDEATHNAFLPLFKCI